MRRFFEAFVETGLFCVMFIVALFVLSGALLGMYLMAANLFLAFWG